MTVRSLTNAQSYCIKDIEPYEKAFLAKLASCHASYCGKAVDIDTRHIVLANVNDFNKICIKDYDYY